MTQPKKSSDVWKALLHATDIFCKGLGNTFGNLEFINVWMDQWIPWTITMKQIGRLADTRISKVSELMMHGS